LRDKAGCLEIDGRVIDESAGERGNRSCIGAVGDRETALALFDERLRLFPIVHRYRDDLDVFLAEFVRRSRKSGKLGVAETIPESAMKQDHTEPTGQIARRMDFAATDAGKGKRGKDIAILQHHNCNPCLNGLTLKAPNDLYRFL
jgi:hypothetical protein